ncbi:hypothetical protein GTY87_09840 [Streptomyces sp. SID7813]|uniref:Uncharacterized protein n=1 Tax=Streptomyces coelicolor (strain ATCC BAA-471 / A3(2) / M145) TaxID=100226 RepID=Q9Z516_STRCO|nr:hypothetical protein [Streptomyces sp. SID7813]QFI42128.1 hypothetical protein FQ762_09930 [Streptomyces coelicolor A3(2)]THA77231.1 hypothetical protein E6R61_38550 [Streptomyces sp. LRa12]CAB38139.1 small hypothetical protein [Streptomyces coelicolor A3(2)]
MPLAARNEDNEPVPAPTWVTGTGFRVSLPHS